MQTFQGNPGDSQLQALTHCFVCDSEMCAVPYCSLMKAMVQHNSVCEKGNCKLCQLFVKIVEKHVKSCTDSNCKVDHDICIRKDKILNKQSF